MVMFNSYVKLPEGSWSTANLACFSLSFDPSYDLIKSSNKAFRVLDFFQQNVCFSCFSWSNTFLPDLPINSTFLGSGNLTHLCTTSTALSACRSMRSLWGVITESFAKRCSDVLRFTWDAEKCGDDHTINWWQSWCLNLSHSIYIYNTQVKR